MLVAIIHDDLEPGGLIGFFESDSLIAKLAEESSFFDVIELREGVVKGKEFYLNMLLNDLP